MLDCGGGEGAQGGIPGSDRDGNSKRREKEWAESGIPKFKGGQGCWNRGRPADCSAFMSPI